MEAVAGSILSGFFDAVFERLLSTDWSKYVGEGKVREQLQNWKTNLNRINAALADAEEMQTTNRMVEIWLNDLKHLAYDLEDVLDEMATKVQQRILKDENRQNRPGTSRTVRKIVSSCCVAVNPTTVKFNREMISKIDKLSARLDKIIKQKNELGLQESNGSSSSKVTQVSESRLTTSVVNEAKVYGRSEDKKAVLELMKKAAVGGGNVAVIPIIGMGGLGKTTLAQLVYDATSSQFDFTAWVCVGVGVVMDVLKITKTILQSDGEKDLNSLQVELREKMRGKKFLLVLDDVWSDNYEGWTRLCGPFESGAPGSTIIITTRLQNVANMTAGTLDTTHELKELSDGECLHVFCQHAFGATNFDQHRDLKTIGEEIIKRCKGLPLAAKALGGLLRGKSDTYAWEEVLESKIWDFSDNIILPALRLSYFYLPPHLKRCFAYCSIFPQNYEFDRDELVLLWMAEGFLFHQDKVKREDNLGCKYFEELLSRSFFQRSNNNRSRYVMHDLMNKLARFVSSGTCFHLADNGSAHVESYPNIRHSSFIPQRYNVSRRFECFYKMMKLRTFLSLRNGKNNLSRKVLYDLLPKLKCLRVLSLSHYYDIEELPTCVCELKQLRYLDLSSTDITRLPESIGKLFHLETLKLNGCDKLIELPKSICDLTSLLYLDISETKSLKEMPPLIGNLASLRVLSKFIVGEGNDGLKISELKKLSQLAGELEIEGLQNVRDIKDENLIKEKPGLLALQFKWADRGVVESNIQDEQTLKSLEPHQNAESVSIFGYGGGQFPSWGGDPKFSKMVRVELLSCKHIILLPPLGRLRSLKELKIEGCPKLIGKLPSSLPSLEKLVISDCRQLTGLPGVLPSLKKLCISECREAVLRNLTNVPRLTELKIERMEGLLTLQESFLKAMATLEKLEIIGCSKLTCLLADGIHLDYLTSLKHLEILGCKDLVSLVNGKGGLLPLNLEDLHLSRCDRLKEINLNGLKYLQISDCPSLSCSLNGKLADSLKFLEIGRVEKQLLESFHNYGFSHLTNLNFSNCYELESFPERELPNIPTLLSLSIFDCKRLKSLTNHMKSFPNLQSLSIDGCCELESFPESGLPNHSLVSLSIWDCENLRTLPNQMQSLTSLQELKIRSSDQISSLEGSLTPNLTELEIYNCEKLGQMAEWGLLLHTLTSLRRLTIDSNSDMKELGLLLPTSLTYLCISRFSNLKSISRDIQNLTSLQQLHIRKCPKLKTFPVKSLPPTLEFLQIEYCPFLQYLCSKAKGQYGPIISYRYIARTVVFQDDHRFL